MGYGLHGTPGLAACLTTLITRGRWCDLGLGWGGTHRYLLGVFTLPFVFAGVVYATVWVTGLGAFDDHRLLAALARLGLRNVSPAVALVLVPLGVAFSCLSTLGEELGWRGLLAPRLVELEGVTKASLLTGLVWSLWHYPLMIVLLPRHRPEPPLWYAMICFTLSVTAIAWIYTWLRLRSGSVWPAVVLHSASASAQEIFEGLTRNTGSTPYLTFEYGIGFTIVIVALVLIGWKRWNREPPAEPESRKLVAA